MFESSDSKPSSVIDEGENSKLRHFFIHRAWSETHYNNPKTDLENIIFEFSYINKQGDINENKIQIKGKALHSMFVASNLKKGPIFIYDKTPYKTSNTSGPFMNGHMNSNFVTVAHQPFTQSQDDFSDYAFRNRLSQLSQYSESSNYENSSMISYQQNMTLQNNPQVPNFQQNTTYMIQNPNNASSKTNKEDIRFVDI